MTRDMREPALLEGHARPTAVFVRGLRQRIAIRACPGLPATIGPRTAFDPASDPDGSLARGRPARRGQPGPAAAAAGREPAGDRGRRNALCVRRFRAAGPRRARGRRFTNLKRILGRPADFAFVARQLARTVPAGHAVAACDEGAWALAGAIALEIGASAVVVRRVPKTYFVSYGDDPAIGDGRIAGERLSAGTPVHLVDDLVFSGQTLRSARRALARVGLDGRTVSAILWTRRADAATGELPRNASPPRTPTTKPAPPPSWPPGATRQYRRSVSVVDVITDAETIIEQARRRRHHPPCAFLLDESTSQRRSKRLALDPC